MLLGMLVLVIDSGLGFLDFSEVLLPPDQLFLFDFTGVIVSPPMETAIMIPIIGLIGVAIKRPRYIAIISGALWGTAHGLKKPHLGFFTAWPFFVFTLCFLSWRRASLKQAFWYTTACHALYNLVDSCILLSLVLTR
jgi:hypothetical protein